MVVMFNSLCTGDVCVLYFFWYCFFFFFFFKQKTAYEMRISDWSSDVCSSDLAMVALQQVDVPLRQAVLDEWADRCRGNTIRNPAGYLFGIIQRAIRGEFNAWAKQIGRASCRERACQ